MRNLTPDLSGLSGFEWNVTPLCELFSELLIASCLLPLTRFGCVWCLPMLGDAWRCLPMPLALFDFQLMLVNRCLPIDAYRCIWLLMPINSYPLVIDRLQSVIAGKALWLTLWLPVFANLPFKQKLSTQLEQKQFCNVVHWMNSFVCTSMAVFYKGNFI